MNMLTLEENAIQQRLFNQRIEIVRANLEWLETGLAKLTKEETEMMMPPGIPLDSLLSITVEFLELQHIDPHLWNKNKPAILEAVAWSSENTFRVRQNTRPGVGTTIGGIPLAVVQSMRESYIKGLAT